MVESVCEKYIKNTNTTRVELRTAFRIGHMAERSTSLLHFDVTTAFGSCT